MHFFRVFLPPMGNKIASFCLLLQHEKKWRQISTDFPYFAYRNFSQAWNSTKINKKDGFRNFSRSGKNCKNSHFCCRKYVTWDFYKFYQKTSSLPDKIPSKSKFNQIVQAAKFYNKSASFRPQKNKSIFLFFYVKISYNSRICRKIHFF